VFVEEELSHLLCLGAICPLGCLETPHVSPIGVVPKKSGGSQLVINMQLLNVAISPPCFKYEDLALLAPLLKEGDYMTTISHKDRFFHVPLLPSHQAYMSRGQDICVSSCPLWNECLAVAIHLLCAGNSPSPLPPGHVGDGLHGQLHCHWPLSPASPQTYNPHPPHLLNQLGWQVNFEKSNLMLSQSKEFLGLLINTTGPPSFKVPPHKSHALWHNINCLLCLFRQQG